MMDSDDDDIYPTNDPVPDHQAIKTEPDADEEAEEGEDDSDEDINFITDAKEVPKPEPQSQQPTKRPSSTRPTSEAPRRSPSPSSSHRRRRSSQSQSQDIKQERALSPSIHDSKPGTDYPARHTSTLSINGNPIHPSTGKPILSTDLDGDFPTEASKPWRKPGADITDYFNYGFDEFTWASYCLRQRDMPKQVKEINAEAEQMKAFVEGIPGGGGGGMPGVPMGPSAGGAGGAPAGGMPGMPSEAEMQQMFNSMMAQGMDPSQMDQGQFMQMMMGGGGVGGPPQGPGGGFDQGSGFGGGGFGGGGGGGGQRGGRRGRGRGNW